jgi:hypothetical protein
MREKRGERKEENREAVSIGRIAGFDVEREAPIGSER